MRALSIVLLLAVSCSESSSTDQGGETAKAGSGEANVASPASKSPGKGEPATPKKPSKSKTQFDCASYLTSEEVSATCGSKVTLSAKFSTKENSTFPCRRGNESLAEEKGNFVFLIEKPFRKVPGGWDTTPRIFETKKGKRFTAGVVKGGHTISLSSWEGRTRPGACTGEQLLELLKKIAPRVPSIGTAPKPKEPNPICDKALPPAAIKAICGKELTLKPTMFEGLAMNPCNRGKDGLSLIVSEHRGSGTAKKAEGVAGKVTTEAGGKMAVSLASGRYLIEVKSRKGKQCTSADKLQKLAAKAAETLK